VPRCIVGWQYRSDQAVAGSCSEEMVPVALFEGDGWWRKNGLTAAARIVEVGIPSQGPGRGVDQKITADVTNAETGEVVRLTSKLWSNSASSVGEILSVRWSPKRDYFVRYGPSTVPKDEWLRDQNAPAVQAPPGVAAEVVGGVQLVNASGLDPASVLEKLASAKQQGLISDDQFEQAKRQLQSAGAPTPAPAGGIQERLQRLERLRDDGTVNEQEYAEERRRILDSL
jgi:hypothetical protein